MKKKIIISILLLAFVIFIIATIKTSTIRDTLRNLLPSNTKVYVKELFFGKQFLEEIKFFRTANFNQKILPQTEFQKLKFEKYNLSFLENLDQTHYGKVMKIQSDVKTFFIDIINSDILLSTVKGSFYLLKDSNIKNTKKLNTNLKDLNEIEIMDSSIISNKIYISYRRTPNGSDCSFFHVKFANINTSKLNFQNIFSPKRCTKNNYGGRISYGKFFNEEGIVLTTGATGDEERNMAQDINSHLGKILFFPFNEENYKIISLGHRNPQGLFIKNNLILSTEHGPYGGDEINKIEIGNNYGWPISSYGEKYQFLRKEHKFNKYTYKKSHKNYNFTEPIFSFVPSIGISEIIAIPNNFSKYWKNNFFVSSLNGVSLYRLEFDKNYKKIKFLEKIIILERIRDIKYSKKLNSFVLALETSGSIGFLKIDKN